MVNIIIQSNNRIYLFHPIQGDHCRQIHLIHQFVNIDSIDYSQMTGQQYQ